MCLNRVPRLSATGGQVRAGSKKGETHAPRKTWYKTERPPQEDSEASERLFPDEIETLPGGPGSGGARPEVCVRRPPAEEAAVPLALDRAHCRGLQAERDELFAVHQRIEKGRRGTGPQDSGRHCRARCGRVHEACGAGQGGAASSGQDRKAQGSEAGKGQGCVTTK